MATLNYKLPGGVLDAYGSAMAGAVNKDIAGANMVGAVTKAAVDPILEGEKTRRATRVTEQEAADTEAKARKTQSDKDLVDFKKNASKILEGDHMGGVAAQMQFQETYIEPLKKKFLAFSGEETPNAKGMDEVLKELTLLGKQNAGMSSGLKKLSENAAELDWDAVPPGKSGVSLGKTELAWLTNFEQSSFNLGVGDNDNVVFTIPGDQHASGKDFVITRDMIEYMNTSGIASGPLQESVANVMGKVRTKSLVASNQEGKVEDPKLLFNADTYESEISDLIKPDNIRSFVFGKKVWGNRNQETKARESWLDNFKAGDINVQLNYGTSAGAAANHPLDKDKDGDVDQTDLKDHVLTQNEKDLLAEMMCLPENFDAAQGILTQYARMNIDSNIQKAKKDGWSNATAAWKNAASRAGVQQGENPTDAQMVRINNILEDRQTPASGGTESTGGVVGMFGFGR
jgi:hypothetical protein